MKTYHKIQNIFKRDTVTNKLIDRVIAKIKTRDFN